MKVSLLVQVEVQLQSQWKEDHLPLSLVPLPTLEPISQVAQIDASFPVEVQPVDQDSSHPSADSILVLVSDHSGMARVLGLASQEAYMHLQEVLVDLEEACHLEAFDSPWLGLVHEAWLSYQATLYNLVRGEEEAVMVRCVAAV